MIEIPEPTIIPPNQPRNIVINGKQTRGRPIEWDKKPVTRDRRAADGEYIKATVFETQCPHCCLRMTFSATLKEAQCPHCKKGQDIPEFDEFPEPFCDPGDYDVEARVANI